jgi:pimeloyl-ACP methyl ester carboxylesterase
MWKRIACVVLTLLVCATPVFATVREARIPLKDGKLRTGDLSAAICRELGMPAFSCDVGEINVGGYRGSLLVSAVNQSLGDGCRISISDNAVVLHIDTQKLPNDVRDAKHVARVFTSLVAPEATAKQRAYYGLWTPDNIDTRKPLVVLIHGLDCDRVNWQPMIDLLHDEGRQVALYTYPSDQPIADSAKDLGAKLADLRLRNTNVTYDLICHSMGGLVAREYVEGEGYRGGVERLILLGTPNRGSKWAGYRWILEVEEHYDLWRHEPDWSPSWMITDGLGEAGSDLKPKSGFLKQLNARGRRDGVKYTIVAGNQNPVRRVTANCLDRTADWIPNRVSKWWGFRQTKNKLETTAEHMRYDGKGDGPVTVSSCKLAGVDDFVVVAADHAGLYYPTHGKAPAAWETIRERLRQ